MHTSDERILCTARALYLFQSTDTSSLEFRPNDIIHVLSKSDSGWWLGRLQSSPHVATAPGWFPKDYVQVIPDRTSQHFMMERIPTAASGHTQQEGRHSMVSLGDEAIDHFPPLIGPLDIGPSLPKTMSQWTIEASNDGTDQYHSNPLTGEMRASNNSSDDFDEQGGAQGDPDSWTSGETDDNGDDDYYDCAGRDDRRFADSDSDESHASNDGLQEDEEKQVSFSPEKLPRPWAKYIIPQRHADLFSVRKVHKKSKSDASDQLSDPALSDSSSNSSDGGDSDIEDGVSEDSWDAPPDPAAPPRGANQDATYLTWEAMSTCIATTIHNLSLVLKFKRHDLVEPYTTATANAIRLMFVASNMSASQDKDNQTRAALRTHHRSVVACMAKLLFQSELVSRNRDTEEDLLDADRFLADTQRMLLAVRNFVSVCQTIPVPLQTPTPVFDGQVPRPSITSIPEESYRIHQREYRENSTASQSTQGSGRTSMTEATSITSPRASFNVDAMFDTAKMFVTELEASVNAMATSVKENRALSGQALAAVLFSRMDHLTQRTGQTMVAFEKVCSDEAGQRMLAQSKEALLNGFGTLFCKLQMLTGTETVSATTVADIEQEVQHILAPVQAMKSCIVALDENMMKDDASDDEDDEDDDMTESGVSRYLRHDYRKRDIAFGVDGQVRGGTVSALVERLTMHDQSDTNFTTTFMLTFRSFCSPIKLLKLLEDRFSLVQPKDLTESELEVWTEKKQIPIRLRVFNIFKLWLEQYFSTEDDMFILDRLLDFNSVMIRSNLSTACADQLERLIKRRREAEGAMQLKRRVASVRAAPEPILPSNNKKFRLLDIHPLELARQLTLIDFGLYSAIQATDCMNKAWSQSDNRIRANIDYNTQVTLWVTDAILCPTDVKKRAQVVKFWIDVAQKCQHLHNFNTLMAILSAFESSAIGRLGRTWEAAGSKSQQALGVLRKVLGTDRNYAEYRTLIHSINPPCIPFLGVYLHDLTFIADGNPDMLVTPRRSTSLINFGKLSKTGAVIRDLQQFQSLSYAFQPVEMLQKFIKANLQSARDEEALYNASIKLEPREREDQKVTRMLSESGFV